MGLLKTLGLDESRVRIDWDITPAATYGLFECRGDMQRVRSKDERYYYFYIDNWQSPPRVCFMERGIRYARVLAYIEAPAVLVESSIREQGRAYKEQNYAVTADLRQWLQEHIVEAEDQARITVVEQEDALPVAVDFQPKSGKRFTGEVVRLRSDPAVIDETEIADIVQRGGFFERFYNPQGVVENSLAYNQKGQVVTDLRTQIVWQLEGCGHTSIRKLKGWVEDLNRSGYGGYTDWRLPTIEEALSLLTSEKNRKGLYLADCFSAAQPYIFTADRRMPGGFWFVDFGQARVYWAAGTCFSGGFGRACRGALTIPTP